MRAQSAFPGVSGVMVKPQVLLRACIVGSPLCSSAIGWGAVGWGLGRCTKECVDAGPGPAIPRCAARRSRLRRRCRDGRRKPHPSGVQHHRLRPERFHPLTSGTSARSGASLSHTGKHP
jgi:hypothetical protein